MTSYTIIFGDLQQVIYVYSSCISQILNNDSFNLAKQLLFFNLKYIQVFGDFSQISRMYAVQIVCYDWQHSLGNRGRTAICRHETIKD